MRPVPPPVGPAPVPEVRAAVPAARPAVPAAVARGRRLAGLLAVALAALAAGVGAVGYGVAATAPVRPARAAPLAVPAGARVLVVAPHPDDEVLAAGVLIQRVLAAGGRVRVVYVTDGDAYVTAARRTLGKVFLEPADFRALAAVRRREAGRALGFLEAAGRGDGSRRGAVEAVHLGFPDKGLAAIWVERWDRSYRSLATAAAAVPYAEAYRPGAPYSGAELLGLLRENLREFKPDVVVSPGVMDLHPDHQATALFVRAAWSEERRGGALAGSTLLEYAVHREAWHLERGLERSRLVDRDAVSAARGGLWLRLDPAPAERERKGRAIRAYASQVRVMRGFLLPFAARPELFRAVGGRIEGWEQRGAVGHRAT